METITAYKTSDGNIFENKEDAERNELLIKTREWYNDNQLYSSETWVNFTKMYEWINNNKKEIKEYFNI